MDGFSVLWTDALALTGSAIRMAGCRNSSMSGRGINERRCVPGSGSANFWLRSLELHAVALSETPLGAIRPTDGIACLEPH